MHPLFSGWNIAFPYLLRNCQFAKCDVNFTKTKKNRKGALGYYLSWFNSDTAIGDFQNLFNLDIAKGNFQNWCHATKEVSRSFKVKDMNTLVDS